MAPAPETRFVEDGDASGMECICCYGQSAIDTMVQCGEVRVAVWCCGLFGHHHCHCHCHCHCHYHHHCHCQLSPDVFLVSQGHLCCFDCINGYVKATAFGESKSKLTCMQADGCTSIFTKSTTCSLQRILKPTRLVADRRVQASCSGRCLWTCCAASRPVT